MKKQVVLDLGPRTRFFLELTLGDLLGTNELWGAIKKDQASKF